MKKYGLVSTYFPSEGGVATYTAYLNEELQKISKEVLVLADFNSASQDQSGVKRCWQKNHPALFFQLYREIVKQKLHVVHFQQELHLFGSTIYSILLPCLFMALRLKKVKVVVTIHGVVPLSAITRTFISENSYRGFTWFYKLIFWVLYRAYSFTANQLVVHSDSLKNYLSAYGVSAKKISVISHGVKFENPNRLPKLSGETEFLFFGYLTGYKGIEVIVDALPLLKNQSYKLTVVASAHPRLKAGKNYQAYYQKIRKYFEEHPNCKFSGYVDEAKVEQVFTNADYLILPYTVHMSSSGPMALALAYGCLPLGSKSFSDELPANLVFDGSHELAKLMDEIMEGKIPSKTDLLETIKSGKSWQEVSANTLKLYERF